MKKENCPFCGHRWIRSSQESIVVCPNCGSKYNIKEIEAQRREEELQEEETFEEEGSDSLDQ